MSNVSKMLYVGITNHIERRVYEHKYKLVRGFSRRYNLFKLVYFEPFGEVHAAIGREKQIKGWIRSKKVALIQSANPQWKDLAGDWFKRKPIAKKVSS